MTLEWSAAALADIDRFAAFLHDRHPNLAKIVAAEIQAKARILEDHPLAGRPIEGRMVFGSAGGRVARGVENGYHCALTLRVWSHAT